MKQIMYPLNVYKCIFLMNLCIIVYAVCVCKKCIVT